MLLGVVGEWGWAGAFDLGEPASVLFAVVVLLATNFSDVEADIAEVVAECFPKLGEDGSRFVVFAVDVVAEIYFVRVLHLHLHLVLFAKKQPEERADEPQHRDDDSADGGDQNIGVAGIGEDRLK